MSRQESSLNRGGGFITPPIPTYTGLSCQSFPGSLETLHTWSQWSPITHSSPQVTNYDDSTDVKYWNWRRTRPVAEMLQLLDAGKWLYTSAGQISWIRTVIIISTFSLEKLEHFLKPHIVSGLPDVVTWSVPVMSHLATLMLKSHTCSLDRRVWKDWVESSDSPDEYSSACDITDGAPRRRHRD